MAANRSPRKRSSRPAGIVVGRHRLLLLAAVPLILAAAACVLLALSHRNRTLTEADAELVREGMTLDEGHRLGLPAVGPRPPPSAGAAAQAAAAARPGRPGRTTPRPVIAIPLGVP